MLTVSFEQFGELLLQNSKKEEIKNFSEGIYHSSYNSDIDTPFCKGNAQNVSPYTLMEKTAQKIKQNGAKVTFKLHESSHEYPDQKQ